MKNIIRSQLFQLKKETLIWISLTAVSVMSLLTILTVISMKPGQEFVCTGSEYFAMGIGFSYSFPMIFLSIMSSTVCCSDFTDKTTNYELMSGHLRKDSYFGRAVVCIGLGIIGSAIIISLPVIVSTIVFGWGDKLKVSDVVMRILLMLLPYARFCCEMICIAFILKNQYIVMGFGMMLSMVSIGLPTFLENSGSAITSITNLYQLSLTDIWSTFGLYEANWLAELTASSELVISTILCSAGFSAAALYLGYMFFNSDDIH
ncbi:MAG: hypothetical protein IJ446_00010 [Oscillospiraceae bacterium]|nr:hypothetical protein [Oscillospiraceae bacterium]